MPHISTDIIITIDMYITIDIYVNSDIINLRTDKEVLLWSIQVKH
jgi:hypothetical protein